MNEDCRIEEFEEKPMVSSSNVISTGIYVIRRRQLIEMIERSCTGRPLRLCKGYFNPLQEPETDLRIQDQYLLEQHCYRRFLLQNQHGFPETGGK